MRPIPKDKTRIIRSVFIFLFIMLLLITLFSACGRKKNKNKATNQEDAGGGASVSLAEYTIVRGDSSGNAVLKAALDLRSAIRAKSGSTLPLSTDFVYADSTNEILIGPTNRPESLQVEKELNDSIRFIIRSIGNKIVISAPTHNNLYAAVDHFIDEYRAGRINSVDSIHIVEENNSLILYNQNVCCDFVIPDDASTAFAIYAKKMVETLQIPGTRVVRYSDHAGGPAVMLGTLNRDEISMAYADSLEPGEYIARTAAGNVYLQGYDELLTLCALSDFLFDMQSISDSDFAGNRCILSPSSYSFNSTWEYAAPKLSRATLDNAEDISTNAYLFYYSSAEEYALSLFEQMIAYLGYTPVPYVDDSYRKDNTILTVDYQSSDKTLSVFLTGMS